MLVDDGLSSLVCTIVCFFKQKTAYEMRISDWSSDVCSSDLQIRGIGQVRIPGRLQRRRLTRLVLGVAAPQIGQNLVVSGVFSLIDQFFMPPGGADLVARRDKQLNGRLGADHGADIDRKSTRLNSSH